MSLVAVVLGLTTEVKCNKITYKPIIVKITNSSHQFLIVYAQYLFDYVHLCGIDLIYALLSCRFQVYFLLLG